MERELMSNIQRRQLQFLGYILRAGGMERVCLLGRVEGSRARGGQRRNFMETLMESIHRGWSVADLVRMAERREDWHSVIADVT